MNFLVVAGIPVWIGRKLHTRYRLSGKHKRNFAVLGGVAASVSVLYQWHFVMCFFFVFNDLCIFSHFRVFKAMPYNSIQFNSINFDNSEIIKTTTTKKQQRKTTSVVLRFYLAFISCDIFQ